MKKSRMFVREITWLARIEKVVEFGWGNGYVVIPEGHPFHGIDYDHIDVDVDVHGGLTYSRLVDDEVIENFEGLLSKEDKGAWLIGFDTAHYMDTLEQWDKSRLEAETKRLMDQAEKAYRKPEK